MRVIFYHSSMIEIGGCETMAYNFCKRLSKYHNILFLYNNCHEKQLERISKYVRYEKYDKTKKYEADICICNTSWAGYPDTVEAKEYIQMIHANYKEMEEKFDYVYKPWKKTTKHIAVSKLVRDIFHNMYGYECDVIYNLLDTVEKPILRLVSATRLSSEKGWERMKIVANELKKHDIPFIWMVFTDRELYGVQSPMKEIVFAEPTYDIQEFYRWADYTVQLSDSEGRCYTIHESMQYGTPVLVTDFDSVHEGVVDGYNGYILDMDLGNLDIDKLVNHIPKDFKYKEAGTISHWNAVLGTKSTKIDKPTPYKIKSLETAEIRQIDGVYKALARLRDDKKQIIEKGELVSNISGGRMLILLDRKMIERIDEK